MPQFISPTKQIFWLLVVLLLAPTSVPAATPQEGVRTALDAMHDWVGSDDNGQRWRRFLKSDLLEAQLEQGADADRTTVAEILSNYKSDSAGLDKPSFVAVREALEQWLAELSMVRIEQLPQLARDMKAEFTPVDAKQVEQAKAKLIAAANRLDAFLSGANSERKEGWQKYVLWDDMQSQLNAEEGPNLKVLRSVGLKYYVNKVGLELTQFVDVREALLDYVNAIHFSSQQDLAAKYTAQLEQFAKQLETFAVKPTRDDAVAIGRTLGWLESAGQAPSLVSAVRRHYCQSNLVAHVSDRVVAAGIGDDVDDTTDVREYILGTSISGEARTVGKVTATLVPNDDAASIEIRMTGQATSVNVGYNGPVTIYTNGITTIDARKLLKIDGTGLRAEPAVAQCTTATDVTGIAANSRVAQNIAWQRVGESKSQAELIASQRAAARVERRMDDQASEMLDKANQSFSDKLRKPLQRRGALPRLIQLSTTLKQLQLRVTQANAFQVAANESAPPLSGEHDLAVRLHDSLVGNISESVLGGQTLTDEALAELIDDLTGSVPDELKIGPDKDPWSITFVASQPIAITFDDGKATVTIRARSFTRGENEIKNAMVITATYEMKITPSGMRLTRQGEVVVKGQQGVAGTVFKTFVQKKFNALFKEEIVGDGLVLPGQWEQIGKLRLRQLDCDKGWLALGWEQPTENVRTAKKEE